MIDALKKNIDQAISILSEIDAYSKREANTESEKKLIATVKSSLENRLRMINASIPEMVEHVAPSNKLDMRAPSGKSNVLEKVPIAEAATGSLGMVTLKKEDREKFLAETKLNLSAIKKMRGKPSKEAEEEQTEFRGARGYVRLSNRFFFGSAQKIISKGYFAELKSDLSKANIDILFSSYIAMMLFSTFLAVFVGVFIAAMLLAFKIRILFPFISPYDGEILSRILQTSWVMIALPAAVFFGFQYYPSSEKDSIAKSIEQELPFAVIHMSAISGSGIEPSEIFKIIGRSKEYPILRKEIRKVLNQINLYGYDLVTSLTNVAKSTPSEKLSELFSGLATTITSGGDMSEFLEKRSETLLMGYRLEREKFTKVAETFMDIYISMVIAAPMILMLLLIMIQISNINIGLGSGQIALLIIAAIAVLNLFFLAFLHVKQPKY